MYIAWESDEKKRELLLGDAFFNWVTLSTVYPSIINSWCMVFVSVSRGELGEYDEVGSQVNHRKERERAKTHRLLMTGGVVEQQVLQHSHICIMRVVEAKTRGSRS
ncbi:hypothetical protein TNCV_4411381 [Trichonephila clavipes]|nr:hypothetical protein TNCV_4411381 [Trichonephila clavipes]